MNLSISELKVPEELSIEDKWILTKYNKLVEEVTENLDKFELGVAGAKLYDFMWDVFCDWYIELVKPRLYDENDPTNETAQYVLSYVLSNTLKLLHPFMPFITEEIWLSLPHEGESIVISDWPKASDSLSFPEEASQMEMIMNAVKAVRNKRAEMNIPPSKKASMVIVTDHKDVFESGSVFFTKLASASTVDVVSEKSGIDDTYVAVIVEGAQIYMPMGELVDAEKEIARLKEEQKKLIGEIKRVEGKLSNEGFVAKAPAHVVEEEKAKGEKYKQMLIQVEESLKAFGA